HPRLRLARGRPTHRRRRRPVVRAGRQERRYRQRRVRALLQRELGRGGVRRHRQCVQQRSRPAQRRRRRRALALAGRTGADRRRTRAGRSGLVVRDLPQRRGGPLMAPRWRFGFRRRQGGEPTPEEREAHIAELRRKRQARLRYLTLRAVLVAGALGLVLVVGLYWLLTTVGGREFLLAQIVQRLPGN